ncbi:hypothetical protein [Novosphingobium arvoryzae]|uniref:Lipoprotein n=1 Tax=Novosphingobium arvoryzae TaxID=1256514 RepID=A0A918RSZ5_9SPHN|nr:hypothetical protein [Novosphingobium arvoryzae]GHA07360.1 hypothetical protein GCM10011617_30030 [Novosphingobium arvoryzae]
MKKVHFVMPLLAFVSACGSNDPSDKPAPSEAPAVSVASPMPTEEISAKKLADEKWDCDTGSPDAAIQRITLSNLIDNNGVVTGDYQNFVYSVNMDDNGFRSTGDKYRSEYGTVLIKNGVYKFISDEKRGNNSTVLPNMKIGIENREKILTQILTKSEQRDIDSSESGDIWAITCKLGHNLNRD